MSDINRSLASRYGVAVAAAAAAFVVGAVVIMWSWNTVAVDLFAAPVMLFRHAVAVELGTAVVGTAIASLARFIAGGRHPRIAA